MIIHQEDADPARSGRRRLRRPAFLSFFLRHLRSFQCCFPLAAVNWLMPVCTHQA